MRILLWIVALLSIVGESSFAITRYVDASASGTNSGTSWSNAYTHLQDALTASGAEDVIHVAAGSYYPDEGMSQTDNDRTSVFALKSGVQLYGGFPAGGADFPLRDPSTHETILSGDLDQNDGSEFAGNGGNAFHVLLADATDASARLDGFTITGGNATSSARPTNENDNGGGLHCSNGATLTISNCLFRGNFAFRSGGAAYLIEASPVLTDNVFQSNAAGFGGALSAFNSEAVISGCSFSDNATVSGDFNASGGAVTVASSDPGLTGPAFIGCSFRSNTATGSGSGGAVFNGNSASTSFMSCRFEGNTAAGGGGVDNQNIAVVTFTNCVFLGNSSSSKGGAVRNLFFASPLITNCSFQGNSSSGGGGAISSEAVSMPTLANCIIWNNANNGDTQSPDASVVPTDPGTGTTFIHCLVQHGTAAALDASGNGSNGNLNGTTAADDPLFTSPSDPLNAPSTVGDLRLLSGSPAIDAGDNAANSTTTDLGGSARISGGVIDLGAFEFSGTIDYAALWSTDLDNDGVLFGVEIAVGTDPHLPDRGSALNISTPSIGAGGDATLTFGRDTDAPAGTVLRVMRSTSLASNSFTEIFRITPDNSGLDLEGGNTFSLDADDRQVTFTDITPPRPRAFYVLQSEFVPQNP